MEKMLKINPALPFQFIRVNDTGPDSGACCPHCGAEGRYIYEWAEYGKVRGAMAGCYAGLTGRIQKDDISAFMIRLAEKQAKNKPLNGFYKTVVRMLAYIESNSNDEGKVDWAWNKIREAVASNKQYSFRH